MRVLRYVPFLVTGLCLAPSALGAADDKIYPGALCVEDFDAGPEIYYMHAGAWNIDDAHARFWCPIVRDDLSADSGPERVSVDVWDGHASAGVTCSLIRNNGTQEEMYATEASIWNRKNYQDRLELGGIPSGDLHNRQTFSVFCTVAASERGSPSGVITYLVRER